MIAIASDHGGFRLRHIIMDHLKEKGVEFIDFGPESDGSCDYPFYADKVCKAIQEGTCDRGILVCGTGIGMSMAANKHKGIRAAMVSDAFSARFTRLHNDANVICLGERTLGPGLALDLVDLFLETGFEGGKHLKRIQMFDFFD